MTSTPKIKPVKDDRSEKEIARAAPVSLPAGSFNMSDIDKLSDTALAKHDDKRADMRRDIVEKANKTDLPEATLGLTPHHKRVAITDERLGVTEDRVVFDKAAYDKAAKAAETEASTDAAK